MPASVLLRTCTRLIKPISCQFRCFGLSSMLKLGPGDENGYAVRFIRFAIIRKIESIDAKDRGYLSIAKLLMHFYNRPVPHIWTGDFPTSCGHLGCRGSSVARLQTFELLPRSAAPALPKFPFQFLNRLEPHRNMRIHNQQARFFPIGPALSTLNLGFEWTESTIVDNTHIATSGPLFLQPRCLFMWTNSVQVYGLRCLANRFLV